MSFIGRKLRAPSKRQPPKLNFVRRLDKIVELLVHLSTIKPGRDQYQAVKVLYLADREHFNRYGRPITFERYVALDYGPVASSALDLIKGNSLVLREAKIPRLPIVISKRERIFSLDSPERPANLGLFSRSDIKVFEKIVEEYGERSFNDLFQLTHDHDAWKSAWADRGNGRSAIMYYEDMLEKSDKKDDLVSELESVAKFMR